MSKEITELAAATAADRLVLAEVHRRLDWIDTGTGPCVLQLQEMAREKLIEEFRFSGLTVKVNGKWFNRP